MASNDNDRASTHATPPEGPRSFSAILTQLDDGLVHHELSGKLHSLVSELRDRAIAEDRKMSGELTLKLKVDVRKGTAEVTADCTTKLPRARREPTTVWVTKGGNLTTEVPRQEKLPLRDPVADAVDRFRTAAEKVGGTVSVSITPTAKDA